MRRSEGFLSGDTTTSGCKLLFERSSCAEADRLKKQAMIVVSLIALMTVGFVATNLWCQESDQCRQLTIAGSGFMFNYLAQPGR